MKTLSSIFLTLSIACSILPLARSASATTYEQLRRGCEYALMTDFEMARNEDLQMHIRHLIHTGIGQIDPNKMYLLERLTPYRIWPKHETGTPVPLWKKFALRDGVDRDRLLAEEIVPRAQILITPTRYTYPASDRQQTIFHVNFADPVLFQYWKTGLFAQDEIQVAEHPILGAWQDLLQAKKSEAAALNLDRNEIAILRNIPRYGEIDTSGIYGNSFRTASREILEQKVSVRIDGLTHLISMAARRVDDNRNGEVYDIDDIRYHLMTATTAFLAARAEVLDKKLVIHTGNWGTGAFGNNPVMIAMVQIFAAHVAGVDELVYNTFSSPADAEKAAAYVDSFFASSADKTMASFLEYMDSLHLTSGRGNGT